MEEEVTETLLKYYLDKNQIKYEIDRNNYRKIRIDTNSLTQRQVKLIRKIAEKVDKLYVESVGFGLITIDLGHYGGLK